MNKKIITIIFTLSTMLFLVGCSFTNNESNGSDKNYTYAMSLKGVPFASSFSI